VLKLMPVNDLPSLADLLDSIRADQIHEEVGFGTAIGREAW